jgi:hypothetical protein
MIVAAIIGWFATLFTGTLPLGLHRFLASWVRYSTHVYAYISLAANPWPGFTGVAGSYPIDVVIPDPVRQNRWKVGFRIFLAVPAGILSGALFGSIPVISPRRQGGGRYGGGGGGGGLTAGIVSFLGWFASLARGRMPEGFRNLLAYGLRYRAEVVAYELLLTERYPNSDPELSLPPRETPEHPVQVVVTDDLRRSRLTVFFRLLLVLPHFVWLYLWSIAVVVVAIVNWFATLIVGTPPAALHRFMSAFVRYTTHVYAYLFVVANPFPGFTGREGSYPVDVVLPPPGPQSRLVTFFRVFLAIPAFMVNFGLAVALYIVGIYLWFCGLFLGRAPQGLRNLGAFALRYQAQLNAYLYLVTERYPFSGPVARAKPEEEPADPAEPLALTG